VSRAGLSAAMVVGCLPAATGGYRIRMARRMKSHEFVAAVDLPRGWALLIRRAY